MPSLHPFAERTIESLHNTVNSVCHFNLTEITMSQELINKLRAQAAALESQMKHAAPIPVMTSREEISRMVADELNRMAGVAKQAATPVPAEPEPSILALMGQAYTEEQQLWISANTKSIPDFIKSSNGKAALVMLLEELQTFLNGKENTPV